jgi:hypothetical protein
MNRRNHQPRIGLVMNEGYDLSCMNLAVYHEELILALDLRLPISCEATKQDQRYVVSNQAHWNHFSRSHPTWR